ncbi:MAG: hypothetical protein ACE5IW_04800 [bacterium]
MEGAKKKCIGDMPLIYEGQAYPTCYHMIIWHDGHVTYTAETSIGSGKYDRIITDSADLNEMLCKQELCLRIALESRKVKHRIVQRLRINNGVGAKR